MNNALPAKQKTSFANEAFNELYGGVNLNIRVSEQTSRPGYQVFPERINR